MQVSRRWWLGGGRGARVAVSLRCGWSTGSLECDETSIYCWIGGARRGCSTSRVQLRQRAQGLGRRGARRRAEHVPADREGAATFLEQLAIVGWQLALVSALLGAVGGLVGRGSPTETRWYRIGAGALLATLGTTLSATAALACSFQCSKLRCCRRDACAQGHG